ncbi:hypothetical protein FHU33_1661 [Blastococcus colisei]|uniref:DUF5642 domain-containing protein n=1 Tax=Blastococcus colisei TaxID=1564162 RepID=A0A543PDV3_9ACTN|nr:hypothetical protein [Blastococcus colisei]TQN42266.1 hypothetical protein FHU33_1661 [Blastococcus colisei]
MRSSTPRSRSALALVASVALVAACGGGDTEQEDAASTQAVSSSAEQTPAPDLASGLLPADAFGPDASVVAVAPEQLEQGAGLAAASAEDVQIQPEACAAAVEGTQPQFDHFDDIAAQSATTGSATTVEVLVRGGPTKGTVSQLEAAADRCPQAMITAPQFGQAAITFEALPVDELGDAAALLRYTTTVTLPDGTQATIPALVGAVQDGDRLLVLMHLDASALVAGAPPGAPADPAAFADLLEQAYETQADALD